MRYPKVIRYAPLALAVAAGLAYLGLYLLNLVYSPPGAGANTAPSGTYSLKEVGGDEIWNWDFLDDDGASQSTVDWSMRFVFADNAEIDKVKDRIDGVGYDPTISPALYSGGIGSKHAWVDDGDEQTGSAWDSDTGLKKGVNCAYDNHMRFYAQSGEDRNYNSLWGYYIVASLHYEYHGFGCADNFWSYESDESWWANRIEDNLEVSPYNWTVERDEIYWNSGISGYQDIGGGNHSYGSDDYGPYVEVP